MIRMKKRYILTTAVLLISLLGGAQQSSAEAKKLLDKTYAAFEASKGIRLTFRASTLDSDGNEQMAMSGTACIKGNKFRLESDQIDVWYDGTTQWVVMKDVNEVNISHPSADEITAVSPLALLGIYRDGYILTSPVKERLNGKQVQRIRMVPALDNKQYREVEAMIDQNSLSLSAVTLTLHNGTMQQIDITDYNGNHNFTDMEFRFNKSRYPNIEIIDLR